jgi:hypothetical protein
METERQGGLLAWQWSIYPDGHRDRWNLAVHLLTVPIFMLGTAAAALAPWLGLLGAVAGIPAMAGVMALQGVAHRREQTPPAPFRGPLDVLARILAEQWITFPRYVLSGGLAKAWRVDDDRALRSR